ncbi:MAG: GNAT family N-acetyltransferase [Acidimicrobiales bacterium]
MAAHAVAEQVQARGGAVWAQRETRPLPALASLAQALQDPSQLVLAGTIDDVVLGYAVARLETLRDGQLLGVVSDLFVEPEARSVGVGEMLIDLVLDWCGQHRCRGVDALVLPGNRDTKNFFETFGFTARAIVVHRPLGPAKAPDPPPGE